MEIFEKQFLDAVKNTNIETMKSSLSTNSELINCFNKERKNAMYFAVKNKNIEIMEFLFKNGIDISLDDNDGNIIMHHAADTEDLWVILYLLMNKAEIDKKNNLGKKPGDGNINIKLFIEKLYSEKLAFQALPKEFDVKLTVIFNDIDFKKNKKISLEDATYFNLYIDNKISNAMAEKDAKEFIKCTAIVNQKTVSIYEWIFRFSILFLCDNKVFNRFIKDYDKALKEFGEFKLWVENNFSKQENN